MDHLCLCYLCIVFVMLSRLFIVPGGGGKLLLSHLVSWDRCGT